MSATIVSERVSDRRVRAHAETRILIDFRIARRRAFWRGLVNHVRAKQNRLPSIQEVLEGCSKSVYTDMGYRAVSVKQIVGSVGRSQDFDEHFMPRHEHLKDRWMNIDRAYHNEVSLPAVELVQVGDQFFVMDGHHRISVAYAHDQHFVDAHVIKIEASCVSN
jgi:hypothetical protein